MKNKIATLTLCLVMAGCASQNKIPENSQLKPFETGDIVYPSTEPQDGAIFTTSQNSMMIGVGKRYNVGDIVIIRMDESIDAQDSIKSKTSQKTSSTSSFGITLPTIINEPYSGDINVSQDKKVEGDGTSSQSHRLEGNIATTVTQIFPNGILEVKGYKEITLERGTETIAITGRIREQDISTADNSVASNRLAGAKIYYRGSGHIYNKSQGGWLSDLVTSPYWPF
ncbi:flagellar basal body L-ring protein FlgH [Vibrio hepatarius]|uniref:flagellar basal body L-ring protein FlgH n=1 Tax=Vibrio hepatarius TaxID=171383 RepID=UPI001C08B88C|nr:flagellar basal body L-ring protein FlgH [Vibrio hepatarius]MBU2895985.1 flagellar basal body L-ring protein FlgH [Vibrio hepatarius]